MMSDTTNQSIGLPSSLLSIIGGDVDVGIDDVLFYVHLNKKNNIDHHFFVCGGGCVQQLVFGLDQNVCGAVGMYYPLHIPILFHITRGGTRGIFIRIREVNANATIKCDTIYCTIDMKIAPSASATHE